MDAVSRDQHQRIQISADLLWNLGFQSLTRAQVTDILEDIYETLELRVGRRLAERMDDNQLATFERIVDGRDEQKALIWLEKNFPYYRDVVSDEFDHMRRTLSRAASLRKHSGATDLIDAGGNAQTTDFDA